MPAPSNDPQFDAKALKRGDLVAEQVKRWITEKNLRPGDKLMKEGELQAHFGVAKGTMREALKALEVQGLVRISTGPNGGATVVEVPLQRTVQSVQNYLFFKEVDVESIYALRRLVEPELAAGALPHLTMADVAALERSIAFCSPMSSSEDVSAQQRQEDLHFHEILANANPNPLLRLVAQLINQLLRHVVELGGATTHQQYQRFGSANVHAHRGILDAIKRNDADAVRQLMLEHIDEAEAHVRKLQGVVKQRLLLDSDLDLRVRPSRAGRKTSTKE
ncbi:FadR/GntR family transcriptional regulator [Aquabacterium humicola]|uniref:FadR/GntR family transcriptional regulator n=1 Tax=Aquabacterium humicola TaxID=3237377 RepID=UPI002542E4B8|nr:FCD domain-containing protein [Rubrivivax pictus]